MHQSLFIGIKFIDFDHIEGIQCIHRTIHGPMGRLMTELQIDYKPIGNSASFHISLISIGLWLDDVINRALRQSSFTIYETLAEFQIIKRKVCLSFRPFKSQWTKFAKPFELYWRLRERTNSFVFNASKNDNWDTVFDCKNL